MQKCLEQYSHSSDAELRLPLWLRVPAPVLGLAPLGTAGHAGAVAELAIWLSHTVCRVRDRDHYRGHSHIGVLRATPSRSLDGLGCMDMRG